MPVLKVLLNEKGEILGTMRTDVAATGSGAPIQATPVARQGQRLIEVTVDEKEARLDPESLHAAIKSKHLR